MTRQKEGYAEKQVSCTPIIAAFYHLASGLISTKLTENLSEESKLYTTDDDSIGEN